MSDGREIEKAINKRHAAYSSKYGKHKAGSTCTCKQVRLRCVLPNYSYDATTQATYKVTVI